MARIYFNYTNGNNMLQLYFNTNEFNIFKSLNIYDVTLSKLKENVIIISRSSFDNSNSKKIKLKKNSVQISLNSNKSIDKEDVGNYSLEVIDSDTIELIKQEDNG